MSPNTRRIFLTVALLLIILPLIAGAIYFYLKSRFNPFYSSQHTQTPYPQIIPPSTNSSGQLIDINSKPIPYYIDWNEADKLVISGIVQESKILQDGTVRIAIPNSQFPLLESPSLSVSFSSEIFLYTPISGKLQTTQEWKGTKNFTEINSLLSPGKQVIIYINLGKGYLDKIKNDLKDKNIIKIGPVDKIIVSI